jgi:DNA invertase Pin-like site-specific DNA recombinase
MRVVIYAAKSTADARGSIPTQESDCTAMAEREGWEVAGRYRDENKSAYHGSRGDGLVQARDHAQRLATEDGEAAIVVQHTDRLARGDGIAASHLVEVLLWAMKTGVRIRSVQDDRTGETLLDAALTGTRNHEDSQRKGNATKSGLARTVERGEWRGGSLVDGYRLVASVDDRGKVARSYAKDPDRAPVIELIWRLALAGRSLKAIGLELARHGYETSPTRGSAKAKPFDSSRIARLLETPAYCGLQRRGDDLVPLTNWPTYVSVEDFYRQQSERAERATDCTPKPGRDTPYAIAGLAVCTCGCRLRVETQRRPRKDGTRKRTYLCFAHRERHKDSPDWCPVGPIDADIVDRLVVNGLSDLLSDIGGVNDAIAADRERDRQRRERKVAQAQVAAKKADKAAELAASMVADALADGDPERAAILTDAARIKRQQAAEARTRANAELDALQLDDEAPEDADILTRLRDALRAPLARAADSGAADDILALNARLAEYFAAFVVRSDDGRVSCSPQLSENGIRALMCNTLGDDRCDGVSTVYKDGSMAVQGLTDDEAQAVRNALERASTRLTDTPSPPCSRRPANSTASPSPGTPCSASSRSTAAWVHRAVPSPLRRPPRVQDCERWCLRAQTPTRRAWSMASTLLSPSAWRAPRGSSPATAAIPSPHPLQRSAQLSAAGST